ncbi:hypothetical protein E4U54_007885 [Claviceps lovelessii]|nr:hypothetical protein E4U54_007885 [Claviceps lovelessii]
MPNATSPVMELEGEISVDRLKTNDGTPRKKRRSRKGLAKRFECTADGCGKSYSRAEHLYRHQLNHSSDHVFVCEYDGCARNFVRADLLKRHMDRHAAKGFRAGVNDHIGGPELQLPMPEVTPSSSEYHEALVARDPVLTQAQSLPAQDAARSSHSPVGNTPSNTRQVIANSSVVGNTMSGDAVSRPAQTLGHIPFTPCNDTSTASPDSAHSQCYRGSLSHYESSQPKADFTSYPESVSVNIPQTQYTSSQSEIPSHAPQHPYPRSEPQQFHQTTQNQGTDVVGLHQIAKSSVGAVFGDDGGPSKSPYIGLPEDFMAYLFNSLPAHGALAEHSGLHGPSSNYGELQDMQHLMPSFMTSSTGVLSHGSTASQRIMSVTNLLDENSPDTNISEQRSHEIFEFIRDRFYEQEVPPTERIRISIIGGDRFNDTHMLSRHMMQAYLVSYWKNFSDQLPIVHRPSFSPDRTPTLLLLGVMIIGAACLDGTYGQDVMNAGAKVAIFLARHLRWEVFMDTNFRPPSELWVFQTLILLETYEKLFSTRELHERAHIHHATTITLMRRGRSLIGNSWLKSPLHQQAAHDGNMHSSRQSLDDWWNHWVLNESTRRAAFAAFIIDSTHATMFGHSAVMATHELRLPLPCDESLWRARSSTDVVEAYSRLNSLGIRPISFLEGLKRTLSHQEVKTTSFGRTALMAGLMSVTYHLKQRDLHINILGGGVIEASCGRGKWREALTQAYDWWKSDFGRGTRDDELCNDSCAQGSVRVGAHIAFDSRIVLHHVAHMAMDTNFVDCQMFARAERLCGRIVRPWEFHKAQKRITEQWAPSAKARNATLSAFRLLSSVLLPDGSATTNGSAPWPNGVYSTRHDILMNRPWVLYFAALIVWCYGYALEGPCGNREGTGSLDQNQQQMQVYLSTYASVNDADELQSVRGINKNTALLMVLHDSFDNARWDLLREGAHLMRNCIILNEGGNVL